ncbi:hypothetical protein FACS189487_01600 [Campylobacterota bacterium]|nr:hypothetical protein FACS189487_01600 [Campylobacterota bacterium]
MNAFNDLKENDIVNDNEIEAIINIYSKTKDLYIRNTCIKLLNNKENSMLKSFFETAYKKERYLDMKINALRGLAHHISENEIKTLLIKFSETLKKRKETTPYNYQEYELLLGKNALPYLYKRYSYKCIKETLQIVQTQYNEMPEAFKGHFTIDEDGNTIILRSAEETSKMISDFFKEQNNSA